MTKKRYPLGDPHFNRRNEGSPIWSSCRVDELASSGKHPITEATRRPWYIDELEKSPPAELKAIDASTKKHLEEKLPYNLSAPSAEANETTLYLGAFNRPQREALQPVLADVYDYLWHVHNPNASEEAVQQANQEINDKCNITKIYGSPQFTLPYPLAQVKNAIDERLAAAPELAIAR